MHYFLPLHALRTVRYYTVAVTVRITYVCTKFLSRYATHNMRARTMQACTEPSEPHPSDYV